MSKNIPKELLSKMDYLKDVSLFRDLTENEINTVVAEMKVREIEAGQFFIKEGDSDNTIYILLEGEVEISKSLVLPQWIQSSQKQEKSLLHLSEKHHPFFGEMAMFDDIAERSASVKTIKTCLMAMLTKKDLLSICEKDTRIGMLIYHNIAAELVVRLRKANRDILKLTTAFTLALEG